MLKIQIKLRPPRCCHCHCDRRMQHCPSPVVFCWLSADFFNQRPIRQLNAGCIAAQTSIIATRQPIHDNFLWARSRLEVHPEDEDDELEPSQKRLAKRFKAFFLLSHFACTNQLWLQLSSTRQQPMDGLRYVVLVYGRGLAKDTRLWSRTSQRHSSMVED